MNGSVRVVSLRVQPLSGSRVPPSRRDGGPQPYGSATPGSWPWPAHWPPAVWSSAGFPTRPCGHSSPLLGPDAAPYTQGRCCYGLRWLKLKGLIVKIEHTNTYVLTPDGQRFAVFYTKVHNRLLRPLLAADRPPAPLPVRQALRTLDRAVTDYVSEARMTA
jgi:hypothetical protein